MKKITVYEVRISPGFQVMYSANRDPWYTGGQYLHFMCKPQGDNWNPPELYVAEPLRPKGDFVGLQGKDPIMIRDAAYQKISHVFESCAEMLPVDFEGERLWVINVLPCFNALNPEKCTWRGTPGKSTISTFEFYDYRLPNYPLFKIPQTMVNQVLLAHGVAHEAYDLKNLCKEHGFTGLRFNKLWSNV